MQERIHQLLVTSGESRSVHGSLKRDDQQTHEIHFFFFAAKEIVEAIEKCKTLKTLKLEGNTLGVESAKAISKALEKHPEFEVRTQECPSALILSVFLSTHRGLRLFAGWFAGPL